MSRKTLGFTESVRIGAIYYWTGVKCNKGHNCARYVSDGACFRCVPARDVGVEKAAVFEIQRMHEELLRKMEQERQREHAYKARVTKREQIRERIRRELIIKQESATPRTPEEKEAIRERVRQQLIAKQERAAKKRN